MWTPATPTPADRLIDAMEMYRKSDRVVRECVQSALLGTTEPESFDKIEAASVRGGEGSYEAAKYDNVCRNVDAILHSLKHAGFFVQRSRTTA